jgi:hypothetical protein
MQISRGRPNRDATWLSHDKAESSQVPKLAVSRIWPPSSLKPLPGGAELPASAPVVKVAVAGHQK